MGKRCDSVNYRDIYKHEILCVNGKNKKTLWFHFVEGRQKNDDDSDKFKINKNTYWCHAIMINKYMLLMDFCMLQKLLTPKYQIMFSPFCHQANDNNIECCL